MRLLFTFLLWAILPLSAQTVLENYACAVPTSVSNANPAVVTCPSLHGYNQRAHVTWQFNSPTSVPSNGATITVDGQTYTFATSINNSLANQILIGPTPVGNTVVNAVHAINDDGVGKGTLYSSATTAHPTFSAGYIENIVYGYIFFTAKAAGPAYIGKTTSSSGGSNGAFDTSTTRMDWNVMVSGATGGWASIGTTASPRMMYARYVDSTHFSLYANLTAPYDSTGNGSYAGQTLQIQHAAGGGVAYPYATQGESWSLTAAVTSDPYFQVTVPGCSNSAHELECSMAYRVPEVGKYMGQHQAVSSFVVSGGVATITLSSPFPYSSGDHRNLLPGGLIWVRNIADAAGAWTHTITPVNDATGTAQYHLVKYVPGASTITHPATDRGGAIGVCQSGCGTSGTATVADAGLMTCTFDNATTAGHWVTVTGYDDRCHDAGAGFPLSTQPIGVVQDTGAAGNHSVWWNGLNRAFTVQTLNGPGDGTGITQITVNVPGYPDGTYPSSTLANYSGNGPSTSAFVDTNYTISPYIFFVSQGGGGYYYATSTLKQIARDVGNWSNMGTNRITFWVKWGKNLNYCGGESANELGTYLMPPGYTNLAGHYYHQFDQRVYNGQWTQVTWTNHPTHAEGANDNTFNYPSDISLVGHPFGWHGSRAYYDALTTFYYDLKGISCGQNATGQTVYISPTVYSNATNEPDELVGTRGGGWSPQRFRAGDGFYTPTGTQGYDLFWAGARGLNIQYEVRYSLTGSLKANGFYRSGLCQNGTTTCSSMDRVSTSGSDSRVMYTSATMPQAGNIWWAIKPVSVPIAGMSGNGQNPTWIVTPVDLHLSGVGDHVTISGVVGNTAANVTNVATTALNPWQIWMLNDPAPQPQSGLTYPGNAGGAIEINLSNHGLTTGNVIQLAGATPSGINGQYTITVVDANNLTLNGTSYSASCGGGCSGGRLRLNAPAQLNSVVSDGSTCTANLAVNHNVVPGWKVYVFGSTDTARLTPGSAPGLATYTVTGTPTATSFTFACSASAGTYNRDYWDGTYFWGFGIQAWPGVAIAVTGNGAYTGGGTIYSPEDTQNFAELQLYPYDSPPAPLAQRLGGTTTSNSAILLYSSADSDPCSITLMGTGSGTGVYQDSGGLRSRTLVYSGLSPSTNYSYSVSCSQGRLAGSGTFATQTATTPTTVDVQISAAVSASASAVDNLVIDYGNSITMLNQSVNMACSAGRCLGSFPQNTDSVVWVRRRWCKNRSLDPACSDPGNELGRSSPEAIAIR
jgi:hypothetical protein